MKRWASGSSYQSPEDEQDFCLDDIRFDGKFTTRGTDIDCHLRLLESAAANYRQCIQAIEDKIVRRENGKLLGDPVVFRFAKNIKVDALCKLAFNSKPPFQIYGTQTRLAANAYRIQAVDLHSGGRLQFEVFQDFIRMYLYKHSCGNSVIRFLTNLERFVSADVQLLDHQEKEFLNF